MRFETRELALPGLPHELDGLRIAHLSDFHLGVPGRTTHAVETAVDWVEARQPELTLVSGDLLTRSRGEATLRRLLPKLPNAYAILGNHDLAISRDPFVERTFLRDLSPVRLLSDEGVTVDVRGRRVYIAGADPRSKWVRWRPQLRDLGVAPDDADLRILVVHYPELVGDLPPGAFDLILAGHMHDGQICVPYPGGKLRLAHPRAPYWQGLYATHAGTMHVSAGLGTTFVPFRFAARPEATELVLRRAA